MSSLVGQRGWCAAVVGSALLALPAALGNPTGAVFGDAAEVSSGSLGAGAFVPAAANALRCETFGPLLAPAVNIRFTTTDVTPPTRGSVQHVLRLVRVDVTPEVSTGPIEMTPTTQGTHQSEFTLTGTLNLLGGRYQARVTTRLLGQTRESTPPRSAGFTVNLLGGSFTCT